MPSSSSVAPMYCLHRPSRGSEAEKWLSITDIVIDVVHSLVMVVVLWYVNIHLCPPSVVALIVSFAHSIDPLKQSKGSVLRWTCCELQFTGLVFISIIQSNCFSVQRLSVWEVGGGVHYNFHNVHGMTDWFILSLLSKCKNCLDVTVAPQCSICGVQRVTVITFIDAEKCKTNRPISDF